MADDLQITVYQTIHAKLTQDFLFDLLRCLRIFLICIHQWVLDIIIKDSSRNYLFTRMFPLLKLCHCVHIDHKLQLQPIIDRRQVKPGSTGFVINDLHIHMLLILA